MFGNGAVTGTVNIPKWLLSILPDLLPVLPGLFGEEPGIQAARPSVLPLAEGISLRDANRISDSVLQEEERDKR